MNLLAAGLPAAFLPRAPSIALALLLCAWGSEAVAQTQPADKVPYQDRVIEGLPTQDPQELAQNSYDKTGLPRGYSLEALWNQQKTQQSKTSALGLKANGYIDTPLYGSISGQLNLQSASAGQNTASSFVLRQIGMPFDGGWRVDNAAGMLNLPVPDMARASARVTLPTPGMRGLSTHWRQNEGLNVMAAWGQSGRYEGYQLPSFKVSDGQYSMLGLQNQQRVADGLWQWSAAASQARNVSSPFMATSTGQGDVNAQGLYAALRREWGASSYAQVNTVHGSNNGSDITGQPGLPATGLWVDGGFAQGAHQNGWGVFWLEPGLGWLANALANDLNGAYWRHNWRTRQWSLESSVEALGSVSGQTANGFFASQSVRYQYSTATSFGGTANLRRYGLQAQSLLLYSQFANTLGSTRVQGEAANANSGERQMRLQMDHDWSFVQSMHLSTSLSVERNRNATGITRAWGAAINADWALTPHLSMTHSVQSRWTTDGTQYSLNTGVNWRLAPHWTLQATAYAIEGNPNNNISLAQSPLILPAVPSTRTRDHGVFVSLRYEDRAGSAGAPVGGSPGSAAGQLSGTVFLDANKNGKRDAAERGAANVTVMLDGRYAVQTDGQGRFDFTYVATGPHVITVVSDNLPLPWILENNGRTEVKVFTRDFTKVDIGAVQQ